MSKIVNNYIYNVIYQILTLILPIITIPYISRVLGSEGVGINAYTYSIVQYFMLLASIGLSLYGNREIAYVRDDRHKLSKTFWGIFYLRVITTLVAYILFLVFLSFVNTYHHIFLIQSINIISIAIDVSWLLMGIEDFKKTVVRNIFVKLIGLIFTFLFVKAPGDLWKYVLILSITNLLGNLSLWFYLPKLVNKVKVTWEEIKKHFKPSLSLFIPQIAIQIYVVLNKTLLGTFSTPSEVGFFDNADKIVKVVLSLATALGTVMLPRVSNTFARGDFDQVKKYISKSFKFITYLTVPLMFGLAAIAKNFAPWFFGAEFNKTGILIIIISPVIVLIGWSNVIGNQFFLPTGKVKYYTISVVVGAIINLLFNYVLIKHFQSIGTAVATVISELSVTLTQFYLVKNEMNIRSLILSTWKYFVSGFIMFIIVFLIGKIMYVGFISILIQIITGMIIYFNTLLILKSEMNKKIFTYGLSIFRKFY